MPDMTDARVLKSLARMEYERQNTGGGGQVADVPLVQGSTVVSWGTRAGWESFKAQNGFYPFGFQGDGYVRPPSMAGAPDFVYELLGQRRPPVDVMT
jgi:hypothetical protein